MTGFERLHPAVQHHVVNSLGWRSLRPLQEEAVGPILAGENCLLLAPTAGGKTEAAAFPVLSAMLSENWQGLSVLYVCPLRALLNNLEERLSYYASLVGRRCGLWHGDVSQALKSKILSDPPDILLTTPESLEALLISTRTDRPYLFGRLRAVVVDEVHAFAADDRGWHLLGVLERISGIAGKNLQRIGLSATVGNPEELLHWMCAGTAGPSRVVAPGKLVAQDADVLVDFVGDIRNAAHVISRLHAGEKRLVFCDSRSRCEELAAQLRQEHIATFVSHSSLSADQRRDAEAAFRDARDCVIVATSTLELGIDVGDLDRVIQLDSPGTVASFLQRLGRTGRRAGGRRNCLFLATSHDSLLQAAAIVELWRQGQVEPLVPPPLPMHVVAQQLMGLVLQNRGLGIGDWPKWIGGVVRAIGAEAESVDAIIGFMLQEKILFEDSGILGMGPEGERLYGGRNYMDLLSVFQTPPLLRVICGTTELGSVHPLSLRKRNNEPAVLSLAGRSWQVVSVNHPKAEVFVIPAVEGGKSRWLGTGQALSFTLCQMIRSVLLGEVTASSLSRRADVALTELRSQCPWVERDATVVLRDSKCEGGTWWTFAGLLANAQLASDLGGLAGQADNFSVRLTNIEEGLRRIRTQHGERSDDSAPVHPRHESLKFYACLPRHTLEVTIHSRESDIVAVQRVRAASLLVRNSPNAIRS